jgi:NADH-quinone oxidoreductase subunit N
VTAPTVEYSVVAPLLVVFGGAVAGVAVEALVSRRRRYPVQLALTAATLMVAFAAVVSAAGARQVAVMGAVAIDGPALFAQGLLLVLALLALLVIGDRGVDSLTPPGAGAVQTAVFPLVLFAVGGMMLFASAADLLTMFIALEVFSLPLYLLCGLARHRRILSREAALKYFLLGAFSSALFLYGIALLYGATATLALRHIAQHSAHTPTVLVGSGLLAVGVLFKIGVIPFHSWVPDVYQGAPTSVVALMAGATKVAAFCAMLRIFSSALPNLVSDWRPLLSTAAALSMALGAVLAVTQRDVKRMLGYSAIAQAGFLLLGVVAAGAAGVSSTLFYLAAYGISVVGAFAVVGLVRSGASKGAPEATDLDQWAGLGRRSPVMATVFAVFLLAFAGIPLTSGFVGKFAVFEAAAAKGLWYLVVVGVLASAVAAFVYARIIVVMFFAEATTEQPAVAQPGRLTEIAVTAAAAVTVGVGVLPQPLLDVAAQVGGFVG